MLLSPNTNLRLPGTFVVQPRKKNAQYDLLSSKRVFRLPVLATRFIILIFVTFILMFPATASSLLSMDYSGGVRVASFYYMLVC